MKRMLVWLCIMSGLLVSVSFSSCVEKRYMEAFRLADSLNHRAYDVRYKDWRLSEKMALEALEKGEKFSAIKAEALNNLAFCAFIRMDFEQADSLLREVYQETTNELECLVADVSMMKICQRTAMNKEFYDYRNRALRRMKRIAEDDSALKDAEVMRRFNYACSDFSITSSIYYYYLQQEKQSLEAIAEIDVESELEGDTGQLLYYYYMKGSGGLYEASTHEDVLVGEFDYLMDCLTLSHEEGYVYFEANALQAMAELMINQADYNVLLQKRPGMMRVINRTDLPWEELVLAFAEKALALFKEYGDWYQIAGTYRTLASCYNELGSHEIALDHLTEALSYVNLHHEQFYHCHDTLDRLKPFVPMATHSKELVWVNAEGIKTVPEWIARLREQLSVTYAALGMKPQSDYNRNIYLDLLDYTRQDKELESRYMALEAESDMLNAMLALVLVGFVVLVVLMWLLNKRWRVRYASHVSKMRTTLDVCRQITASVPSDAREMEDVVEAVMCAVKEKMLDLVEASEMEIRPLDEENGTYVADEGAMSFELRSSEGKLLGVWSIYSDAPLKKDYRTLLEVIVPYLSWTLENGLALISLGDEHRRLEKEQYVHEQHLIENKRQNLIKKACLFIVTGITPYIDRVVNEVHKLTAFNYLANREIKEEKYKYMDELITRINEYNEILSLWVKMRQGSLNLNIENFELDSLFEVLQKGRKNFEMKKQTFLVQRTGAWVKADKALTLFMINTLAENARKYTRPGGKIEVYAREEDNYVEISVCDNGPGISPEDVKHLLDEKVYDSSKIGLQTSEDVNTLQKNKGSGFGLMNCKGIIEKYRKTNDLFRVCSFNIESQVGKGSRFYFRLPKGVRRVVFTLFILLLPVFYGCSSHETYSDMSLAETLWVDSVMNDTLLFEANRLANRVYESNLEGDYAEAVFCADSALTCLNNHYQKYANQEIPLLQLVGQGEPAELDWFLNRFDTDYYTLLDVRNEAAVAYLALGNLEAYQYNNQVYTALYKLISVDDSLEGFCAQMQLQANNKIVAIILCIFMLLVLLVGYYMLYLRHRLMHRYALEQVLEINRRTLATPSLSQKDVQEFASVLVKNLFKEMNELVAVDVLGIAVYSDERNGLFYAFSSFGQMEEEMKEQMAQCFASRSVVWPEDKNVKCLPLSVKIGEDTACVGVMALHCAFGNKREDDRLMVELVSNYVAIIVYNAVELVSRKYRDIEVALDEARRVEREENQLHVQNMVLDNCLSTIKHETVYYPNRIKYIIDKLRAGLSEAEECKQVETIQELIEYYKDIFTILSSCAARQLEEITFRRGIVRAQDLVEFATRYFKRATRKLTCQVELKVEAVPVAMSGDAIQLKFLLENLISEALTHVEPGMLELQIKKEGAFVRVDFIDRRRSLAQEDLNQLFYPHLSRMQQGREGVLKGTEFLICKQIIRDHDEFAGRRGCRINASPSVGGGYSVWFTVPAR